MALNYVQIGKRIKLIRKRRGLSQMVLAEKTDLSTTYISLIENGLRYMSLSTFIIIANALNVSADELLIDNLDNTIIASNHEFAVVVQDCTEYEKRVILEVSIATKQAIRSNRHYLSPHRK